MSTPTDTLYPQQSHLELIGDIEAVWDDYTGRGVHVAVYDSGIDTAHPDLLTNYDPSLHFTFRGTTQDGLPETTERAHGTAVAGIIAAAANAFGTVGIAHAASVTAVELDPLFTDLNIFRAGFRHAKNFDVMNNSWGLTAPFWSDDVNLNVSGSTAQVLDSLYAEIASDGRGGLGTVIVQAAGNDSYLVAGDGVYNSRFSIVVGASLENGVPADYTNLGSAIFIFAPVARITTDYRGDAGYNEEGSADGDPADPDYTSNFGGTSSAAAVVSGVVALMLEVNPNLGWRDVKNLLAMSASRDVNHTHWIISDPANPNQNNWNGGGLTSASDGFGRLDVRAAVRMAEAWAIIGAEARTSANEVRETLQFDAKNLKLRDAEIVNAWEPYVEGGSTSVFIKEPFTPIEVETVEVTLNLTHSYAADLQISLTNGEKSIILFDQDGGDSLLDSGLTWTFKVEGFRGMISNGNWRLTINDLYLGDTGFLESASITVSGAPTSVDDVYTFTNDAIAMAAADPGRLVLDDTDGGSDWMNLSAISSDLQVNFGIAMNSIYTDLRLVLARSNWTNEIENFILGDGDDQISDNSRNNLVYGMRGDDYIELGEGRDEGYGGAGNDTLYGDSGGDVLFGGDGDDEIAGFSGIVAFGGDGADRLNGQYGRDTLHGDADADRLVGNDDNDLLFGGDSDDTLAGGNDDDTLYGGEGADVFLDNTFFWNGNDSLFGGKGKDRMLDTFGFDTMFGEAGDDTLTYGFSGELHGGRGNDLMTGGSNVGHLYGGAGSDTANGGTGSETLVGGSGNDIMSGGGGDDEIMATAGTDRAHGDAGNDLIRGGRGHDSLYGGLDHDLIRGEAGDDLLVGDDGDDSIFGWAGDDDLSGGLGADALFGGDGEDRFHAGEGNDELTGGRGADIFFFRLGSGRDIITDFRDNTDALRLDHNLWLAQGDLTGRQVVQTFGTIDAQGHLVLDFGADVLVIAGLGTLQALYDDLRII